MIESEIWKPIVGWEGLYEVSNLGRVRSIDRKVPAKNGSTETRKGKIKSLQKTRFGYMRVSLNKAKCRKTYMVHRLVADAFLPNPDNLPFINHKNETRDDNRVENLEWCTRIYNMNYGTCRDKQRKSLINNPLLSKRVVKCDIYGNPLEEYPSMAEAARQNKLCQGRISNCCLNKKKSKTHGGYIWKFA